MAIFICKLCGGEFTTRQNYEVHMKLEKEIEGGKEGIDYVCCRVCGMRAKKLAIHLINRHGLNTEQYHSKFEGAQIDCEKSKQKMSESVSRSLIKDLGHHVQDRPCKFCGEIMNHRCEHVWEHYKNCTKAREQLQEGRDYVVCPECGKWGEEIGFHLNSIHGLNKKLRKQKYPNLKTRCDVVQDKIKKTNIERYGCEVAIRSVSVQAKVKETCQKNYNTDHPWKNKEVHEKQKKTMQERYGVDYTAQSPELYAKTLSKKGYTVPEVFLDENTCDNVLCTGKPYEELGGSGLPYVVGFRDPVVKGDRTCFAGYPDFVILTDDQLGVIKEWLNKMKTGEKITCPFSDKDRAIRTGFVIEVFGDYWHGEGRGLDPEEHFQNVLESYESAGVSCLILWEHELNEESWNNGVKDKVEAFVKLALESGAEFSSKQLVKRALPSVDKRFATLPCPYGSGRKFLTQESLNCWLNSQDNLWKPGLVEGIDYVVCPECGYRAKSLTRHIKREHGKEMKLEVSSVKNNKILARIGRKFENGYESRVAYRMPDGSLVRRKTPWLRAWNNNPPSETKLNADDVRDELDKKDNFAGQVEGVDYVTCTICGYKAKILTQHLRKRHGEEVLRSYAGKIKSDRSESTFRSAMNKNWATRRAEIGGTGYKRPTA
jgi:predicted transcriptional regulator